MAAVVSTTSCKGHDMHPFFKVGQIHGAIPSDTEEPHPKRQRTVSPENKPAIVSNWEGQLKAAAAGVTRRSTSRDSRIDDDDAAERLARGPSNIVATEPGLLVETLGSTAAGPILANAASTKSDTSRSSPQRMLKVRPDGKLASPIASPGESAGLVKGALSDGIPRQMRDSTAAKTILKLYPDGKLVTSIAATAGGDARRKGQRKISNFGAKVDSRCMVVMRYGANEDTRGSMVQKVNNILSGASKELSPGLNKPCKPAKATHPFFTTKPSRKTDQKSEPFSVDEGNNSKPSQLRKTYGPTQSRITSKPPGAVDISRVTSSSTYPTFGTDHAKVSRFPGAQNPMWPPFEMLHVGTACIEITNDAQLSARAQTPIRGRKLKDPQIQISSEEDVFGELTSLIQLYNNRDKIREVTTRGTRKFRRPCRKVITSQALQSAVRSRIASSLPGISTSESDKDGAIGTSDSSGVSAHEALVHVYNDILHSRAAFDVFRCETQEWIHKYSPKTAEHVLQQGREALILRNWLKKSVVSSESGHGQSQTRDLSLMGRRGGAKASRKIKRKPREFDGFLVPSDDEANDADEVMDPGNFFLSNLQEKTSVVHADPLEDGKRNANTIVLSGPHGCGKTATVFAVAQELGFEIFEVNAGSRRSGKDVLDRIGDMTRNHLVKHQQDEKATHSMEQSLKSEQTDEEHQEGLHNRRQGTISSLLPPKPINTAEKPHEKDIAHARLVDSKGEKSHSKRIPLQENMSNPRDQKQSLILLEEVDILFEEDKLFWATVMDLIIRSKRPVVLTCSDESLLPLNEMALFAILRFTPPPESLATDYLLLVAASEGHLLSREAVQNLYAAKRFDLRASLVELNFFCQMGIGDSKGGLEWMPIDKPTRGFQMEDQTFRVVSEDTYCNGMGCLGGEDLSGQICRTPDEVADLCARFWNGWNVDVGASDVFAQTERCQSYTSTREDTWHALQQLDKSCEAFSAADILPAPTIRNENSIGLDCQQPDLTERSRCNYIEGQRLLQTDPLIDMTGTSEAVAVALRASAITSSKGSHRSPVSISEVIDAIPQILHRQQSTFDMSKLKLLSSFHPMTNYLPVTLGTLKGSSNSIFDGPISPLMTDVAPFVRAIVSYDIRLENQRRQLNSVLTRPGTENNKTRTTRASRAALEGGSKASTRRERWFPANTDFEAVLQTGGKEWQEIALQVLLGPLQTENNSEREPERSPSGCESVQDMSNYLSI